MLQEKIKNIFEESIHVKEELSKNQIDIIIKIAEIVIQALRNGGKVILFGNGGSAADSQHIACELMGRFKIERPALSAISLSTNTSTLTSVANDYNYGLTFSRQLEGLGRPGDVAIGISTSGGAPNVVAAIELAKKMGIKTIAFTGGDGGKLAKVAEISLLVPSQDTPRIQESHITVGHIICELVEEALFNSKSKYQKSK